MQGKGQVAPFVHNTPLELKCPEPEHICGGRHRVTHVGVGST